MLRGFDFDPPSSLFPASPRAHQTAGSMHAGHRLGDISTTASVDAQSPTTRARSRSMAMSPLRKVMGTSAFSNTSHVAGEGAVCAARTPLWCVAERFSDDDVGVASRAWVCCAVGRVLRLLQRLLLHRNSSHRVPTTGGHVGDDGLISTSSAMLRVWRARGGTACGTVTAEPSIADTPMSQNRGANFFECWPCRQPLRCSGRSSVRSDHVPCAGCDSAFYTALSTAIKESLSSRTRSALCSAFRLLASAASNVATTRCGEAMMTAALAAALQTHTRAGLGLCTTDPAAEASVELRAVCCVLLRGTPRLWGTS